MKLLVIAPYFYPKIGGMEKYAWEISKGLHTTHGWEVVVVTSNHLEKKYTEEVIEGIKIYRLPYWFKLSNTPINPMWFFDLKRIIKKEKPDVINGHTPVPYITDLSALVAKLLHIPFVLTYHSGSMMKGKKFTDVFIYIYENTILRYMISQAIAISYSYSDFIEKFKNSSDSRFFYIPPAVDSDTFKPSKQKKLNKTILYVGRVEKSSAWKGISYLLDAMPAIRESIRDVELEIIGSGDALDTYRVLVNQLGLSDCVLFRGQLIGHDLVERFQSADVLVLPSITDAESFGIVLIEAMAAELPVIGTRIGGIPFVIDDGVNGILVEPKNSRALADAIVRLLSDSQLATAYGINGRKKVLLNYGVNNLINNYGHLLNEITK